MHNSFFQIFRSTPWNPNTLHGSGAWDFKSASSPDRSNKPLKGRIRKYVLFFIVSVLIAVPVVLVSYHLDVVKWLDNRLSSFTTYAQSVMQKERTPGTKSTGIKKTKKQKQIKRK